MRAARLALAAALRLACATAMRTGWRAVTDPAPWVFLERFCFESNQDGAEDHAKWEIELKHTGGRAAARPRRGPAANGRGAAAIRGRVAAAPRPQKGSSAEARRLASRREPYTTRRAGGFLLLYFGTGTNDFKRIYGQDYSDMTLLEKYRLVEVRHRIPAAYDEHGNVTEGSWSYSGHLRSGAPRYLYVAWANYDKSCNDECQTAPDLAAQEAAFAQQNTTLEEMLVEYFGVELDHGWYVAPVTPTTSAFCNPELTKHCMGPTMIEYDFTFTNGNDWLNEFSFDENILRVRRADVFIR